MAFERFDELDRQIVHALYIDGRAPFNRIGSVLGVSDKTVARRYARLRSSGVLRVIGHSHVEVLGQQVWLLKIGCAPGASNAIAEALARRVDTSWVGLLSGGAEVVCAVQNDGDDETNYLMLTRLPQTPRVESVVAQRVIRPFAIEETGFIAKHGPLRAQHIEMLRADFPVSTERVEFTEFDNRLRALLLRDGRLDFEKLAQESAVTAPTVRRRVAELRACGALDFGIELDWRLFGLRTRAALWMTVEPSSLDAVGRAMADHPEISSVSATTGPANLVASVVVPSDRALYDYLSGTLGTMKGVLRSESAPVVRIVKQRSLRP